MLTRILPAELAQEDLLWLHEANEAGPEDAELQLADIVNGLWAGDYQLFRAENGVMLTEVCNKRLNLVKMAGVNLALHFQSISADLQHFARELGCNAIECIVYSEKLAKALRRVGARREAVVMVLELDHGQE